MQLTKKSKNIIAKLQALIDKKQNKGHFSHTWAISTQKPGAKKLWNTAVMGSKGLGLLNEKGISPSGILSGKPPLHNEHYV